MRSLLLTVVCLFALAAAKLGIPFKENFDSKFVFGVEQFDDEHFLDCTGELFVRKLDDQLLFQFRNFEIHKHVNIKRKRILNAVSIPISMKIGGNGKLLDPKDYEDWDWVDPRIVVKVIKYSDIPETGNVKEESWEVSDLECPPSANVSDHGSHLQLKLDYQLAECIDPVEEEVVKEHYRIIKMDVDKKFDYITRIDYHYQKTNSEFDKQNNIFLTFQEFVKI